MANTCHDEDSENVAGTLGSISFWTYIVSICMLVVVLGFLIVKKGNWVAILLTVVYICGYLVEGYTLSGLSTIHHFSTQVSSCSSQNLHLIRRPSFYVL